MAELTQKQKQFCDEYIKCGNATDSYQLIYKCSRATADANGSKLLGNTRVKTYIKTLNKRIEKSTIADMTEIKEFWTSTVRSKEQEARDRLKASELIAKTNGAFIDKVESTVNAKLELIDEAYERNIMAEATPEELAILGEADKVYKAITDRINKNT